MHVLAIAGSLRAGSYNRQLAETAQDVVRKARPDVGFTILAWNDVPFMNEDAEDPPPAAVTRVRTAVREADGLWLFSPEYNHAIPGPFKNLLDWLSRPEGPTRPSVLVRKPIALAGASVGMSGASHAQDQIVGMLSFIDANVMNKPRLSIPHVASQAKDGVLELTASAPHLEAQAEAFIRFLEITREGGWRQNA
ncbi:NADPH-dependent FMN reductase [Gordonibacter sp. An230]|uniref:NADPH-dependent FMN reductase n=1 Tax=Gordonibacter sp. An230 TaxID=1965592 RepID=UPI000B3A6462|nr:NADPH-dependent FMN reductase [Gordonibacter sp. An230]OUO90833.1 NADPH-dependent FMN reductase [Gordonibacter sp. An230]